MIKPESLKKGDQILIVSPAGKIAKENVYPAVVMLEKWGLDVKISTHVFGGHYRFAGTDEQRISDMQLALDDANIKAIICARGGYGTIRLVEKLDFTLFMKRPKWLIGFSDITVFHAYFNTILKCESLHGIMPINFPTDMKENDATDSLKKALFGKRLKYRLQNHPLNRYGKASGELVGGNLAVLCSLLGTSLGCIMKGKILFIEDVGENIHNIDRMMHTLKLSGKLANLKGLLVGAFTSVQDDPEFGKTAYEIIYEAVKDFSYPIVFDFPAGHIDQNMTLCMGKKMLMKVVSDGAVITYKKEDVRA